MLISEVIKQLQEQQDVEGDIEVLYSDHTWGPSRIYTVKSNEYHGERVVMLS